MRILLADSDCRIREILSACLLMAGDRIEAVHYASSPSEVVEKAMTLCVDAVVVDVSPFTANRPVTRHPAVDGIRAIEILRANHYRGSIISVSSAAYDDLERVAREAGATSHLSKPFLLEDFMRSLAVGPVRVAQPLRPRLYRAL